jgi:hypothetical protein
MESEVKLLKEENETKELEIRHLRLASIVKPNILEY